jgi:hypothetical protein
VTKRLTRKKNSRAAAAELEKMIMAQCVTYDGETGRILKPEVRMLFAVIGKATTDLLRYLKPKPPPPEVKTKESRERHFKMVTRWRAWIGKAEDAENFFFSEGLDHYADQLQLNADWVRNKVKTLLEMIREEKNKS